MSELWLPGRHDDFVDSLQRQIAGFAERHGAAVVEVELRDGSTFAIAALSSEPGGGFVTLVPARRRAARGRGPARRDRSRDAGRGGGGAPPRIRRRANLAASPASKRV
jgi:hypothetical protein